MQYPAHQASSVELAAEGSTLAVSGMAALLSARRWKSTKAAEVSNVNAGLTSHCPLKSGSASGCRHL